LDDLLQSGLAIRVATIPAPHDPDSFIRDRGAEAFRNLIENAQGFFDYLLDRLVGTNDGATDRGRMAIVNGMAEYLHKTGNAVLVDTYAQKTAQRLGVSIEAVRAEFRKGPRPSPARRETTDASPVSEPAARPAPQESWLLRLLLGNDALVPLAADRLDLNWLQHAAVRDLIRRRLEAEAGGTWRGVAVFLGQFEDAQSRQLITEAVSETLGTADPERLLHDVLRRLRDTALDREIVQVNRQIADNALSDGQRFELLRRKQGLVAAKQAPLRPA
jgi:DNA primase